MKAIKKSVEVEDDQIILGNPLQILKYGKIFKIEQIKWVDWDKYTQYLGLFLNHYYVICGFSKLPDSLNDLAEFRNNVRSAINTKEVAKILFKMMKLNRWNTRFIKKKFTPDDIAEFFIYSYMFNIEGVKKNFKGALKLMGVAA